jgi:hypothetical protein
VIILQKGVGKYPISSHLFAILARVEEISALHAFKASFGIPSGPGDFNNICLVVRFDLGLQKSIDGGHKIGSGELALLVGRRIRDIFYATFSTRHFLSDIFYATFPTRHFLHYGHRGLH